MQAQAAIQKKAHTCIVKAKNILITFENTLDMKYSISNDLLNMYEYMIKRLTEANIKKNVEILEEILKHVKGFRDTWEQAVRIAKSRNYGSPSSLNN